MEFSELICIFEVKIVACTKEGDIIYQRMGVSVTAWMLAAILTI